MNPRQRLGHLLLRLGRGRAELLIVAVSVALSLILSIAALLTLMDDVTHWGTSLAIATAMPLAVATPVSMGLMTLLRELERARREAHALARTDPLTRLFNRRHWIDHAERELARAGFEGNCTTVLMVDVDNFKAINDQHGHAVGDRVLVAVAQACLGMLRPADVIARWGGEEFLVLLPGTEAREGIEVAERLRHSVAAASAAGLFSPAREVSVSIGVADSHRSAAGHVLDDLLRLADEALYTAKQEGRDCVRHAGGLSTRSDDLTEFAFEGAS